MLKALTFLAIAAALHAQPAQPPDAGEFTRAITTQRLSEFPKVHRDGRVWLQFKAPNAKRVQAQVGNTPKTYDMERAADGTWSLVVPRPGYGNQLYHFIVDGVVVQDPGSETFFSNGVKTAVEVPSPGEDFYDVKDAPHGHVLQHMFYSKVAGGFRRMFIYTPPGYETSGARRYPVLYLQHGNGEDETEWTHAGRAQFILDNLIAEKKAVPMILVMNNSFVTKAGAEPVAARAPMASRFAAFEEMLVKDVIPNVDASFRTLADRNHRALAGLSLGGMQTFQIGPAHLDLFSYLGMFSGTPMAASQAQVDAIANQGAAFNRKVNLIWFGVGTEEKSFYDRTREVRAQFEKAGIRSGYYESPGTAHEFQTWRRCLHEFAPQLFRTSAPAAKKPLPAAKLK